MTDMKKVTPPLPAGLRTTAARRRLLEIFTADRAWTAVQTARRLGTADLSTVYRNMHLLTDRRILAVAPISGEETYFELAGRPHHEHLICEKCGEGVCVPCPLKGNRRRHRLEFYGFCPTCRGR